MPAGRVPAGRVPAGRVPAGRVPAGRVPAGRVPAGRGPMGRLSSGTNRISGLRLVWRALVLRRGWVDCLRLGGMFKTETVALKYTKTYVIQNAITINNVPR